MQTKQTSRRHSFSCRLRLVEPNDAEPRVAQFENCARRDVVYARDGNLTSKVSCRGSSWRQILITAQATGEGGSSAQ
jgi:hypothetical protein